MLSIDTNLYDENIGVDTGRSKRQLKQHFIPIILFGIIANAALGSAMTVFSHWVGTSIMQSAGHEGYTIRGSQFSSPALLGLAAGPIYHWAKQVFWIGYFPTPRSASSRFPKYSYGDNSRTTGDGLLGLACAALVGVLSSLTAHHRGDLTYPGLGQGAAIAVIGDAILTAAAHFLILAMLGLLCGVCLAVRKEPKLRIKENNVLALPPSCGTLAPSAV